MKTVTTLILATLALLAISASAQQFPAIGDDQTSSLGSFKIQVTNATVAPLFNGCPGWNNPIFSSPTMYDGNTQVGRSDALLDGSPADQNGVPVGTAKTIVSEAMLFPPAGFPCSGVAGCLSGPGTREIHTEVRSLKMARLTGGGPPVVRAGVWYDNPAAPGPPSRISPGEVESHSGPGGAPANDLPASSFFDVFVKVDMPACGTFPGATLFNSAPLIVKNFNLTSLPPRFIYLHDTSTVVPILFFKGNPPLWNAGDILGYFVLAGHGIGYTNSTADVTEFEDFMNSQPVTCVRSTGTVGTANGATTETTTTTSADAVAISPCKITAN